MAKKDSGWYDGVLRQRRENEARKTAGQPPLQISKPPTEPTAREGWIRWIALSLLFVAGAAVLSTLLRFFFGA